jgi:hypothetical protein
MHAVPKKLLTNQKTGKPKTKTQVPLCERDVRLTMQATVEEDESTALLRMANELRHRAGEMEAKARRMSPTTGKENTVASTCQEDKQQQQKQSRLPVCSNR